MRFAVRCVAVVAVALWSVPAFGQAQPPVQSFQGSPGTVRVASGAWSGMWPQGVTGAAALASADGNVLAGEGYLQVYCTNFGLSVPSGDQVLGVVVNVVHKADFAMDASDDGVYLTLDGMTTAGTDRSASGAWGTSYATVTYGSNSTVWVTGLTASQVSAPGFGVVLAANSNQQYEIDQVSLTVVCQAAAPPRSAWTLTELQGYGSLYNGAWVYAAVTDPNASNSTFVLWFNNLATPAFGVFKNGNTANWAQPAPGNLDGAWTSTIAADALQAVQNGEFGAGAASDNAFVGMLVEGVNSAAGFGGSSDLILGALVPSKLYYDGKGGPAFAVGVAGGKWAGTPSNPPAQGGNAFAGEVNGGPPPPTGVLGVVGGQAGFGGGTLGNGALQMGNLGVTGLGGQGPPAGPSGTIGTIGLGGSVGTGGSSGTSGTSGVSGTSGSGGSSTWAFLWTWMEDAAEEVGGWFYYYGDYFYDRTVGSMLNEGKNLFCWLLNYCLGYINDGVAWLGQYLAFGGNASGGSTNDASTAGSGETVTVPKAATISPSNSTGTDGSGGTGKGPNDNKGARSLIPGPWVLAAMQFVAQAVTFMRAMNCWFAIDAGLALWASYYSVLVVLITYRLVKSWIPTLSG